MIKQLIQSSFYEHGFGNVYYDIESQEIIVRLWSIYLVFYHNTYMNQPVYSVYTNDKILLLENMIINYPRSISEYVNICGNFIDVDLLITRLMEAKK